MKRRLENGKDRDRSPHECVTWKWERLKGWIEEEARAAKSLQFWLQSEGNRQPLVGSSLAEAEKMRSSGRLTGPWAKRYLSDPDAGKLNAWIAESATREQAEQERLRRDRRRAIVTAVAAGLAALLVGGLAIWAFQQKSVADVAQEEANSERDNAKKAAAIAAQEKKNADSAAARAEEQKKKAESAAGLADKEKQQAQAAVRLSETEKHNAQTALARLYVQDGMARLEYKTVRPSLARLSLILRALFEQLLTPTPP